MRPMTSVTLHPAQSEQDIYRLVLISPESRRCLAEEANGTLRLPRVAIPKWTRPAQEVSRIVGDNWALNVVVIDFFGEQYFGPECVVAELLQSEGEVGLGTGRTWCSVTELVDSELRGSELAMIEDLVAGGTTVQGPFSRLGWLDDAVAWIGAERSARDFHFTGELQQFNANGRFRLVRLGNSRGPAYWLKAVGEPNLNEFTVTVALAKHLPEYLPNVVAMRPEWSAWVMEDAGNQITEPLILNELERATLCLAELQKNSIEHTQTLLSSGCFDQRTTVLHTRIPEIIHYLIDAMANQTSTKEPRLTEARLREIGSILSNVCVEIEALGIPEALIHNDFTLGNVLFNGSRCVLTDWAEACIGCPLATYQHLRAYVSRDPQGLRWLPGLDDLYKRSWSDVLSESQVGRAITLAPPFAIASYLLGRGNWLVSGRGEDPQFQRYARGCARHIDKAAAAPEFLEALCS
jgi:hypothetical protein